MRIVYLLLVGIVFVLAVSSAHAQSAGPYELAWSSIDAGGGTMSAGAYNLTSAIGQPEAGTTQSGGGYDLNGGVVDAGGSGGASPGGQKVYLPLVLR
jgi:hypothetical protein